MSNRQGFSIVLSSVHSKEALSGQICLQPLRLEPTGKGKSSRVTPHTNSWIVLVKTLDSRTSRWIPPTSMQPCPDKSRWCHRSAPPCSSPTLSIPKPTHSDQVCSCPSLQEEELVVVACRRLSEVILGMLVHPQCPKA